MIFMTSNGHTYRLFKNIFSDFSNRAKRGDKYGLTSLLRNLYFDTKSV